MIDVKPYPITQEQLQELGGGLQRLPGSFDDFLEVVSNAELRIDFVDDELVFMSYATDEHEMLVAQLLLLIGQLQLTGKSITARGSNHRIHVEGQPKSFAPDLFFVKGTAKHFRPEGKYQVSMVTNPWLVVEVLSPGTKDYDLGTKLPAYQSIPSAEFILYAQQEEPKLTLYQRLTDNLWSSRDFDLTSPPIAFGGVEFSVESVYRVLGEIDE